MRQLVAAQVAVIECSDEDINDGPPFAIDALDQCIKEITETAKQLRKECDSK